MVRDGFKCSVPPDYPGAMMYGDEEIEGVVAVLKAKSPFRYYGPAPLGKVSAFEKALASHVGVDRCLAVSSGTAALVVAMRALGIGPRDEVILPANTFIASAGAVLACGALPVFVDVDASLTINPTKIEGAISERTRAIMPVHFGGIACDMDPILKVARAHGLLVVEDCAQACGASYKGRKVGSIGDVGCFSFQLNKLITTGDGGAVTTNQFEVYKRAVRAHDHGNFRDDTGHVVFDTGSESFAAENYRMSELAGAVGLAQIGKLPQIISRLRDAKGEIKRRLGTLKNFEYRRIPDEAGEVGRRLILYAKSAADAEGLAQELHGVGFAAEVLYGGKPVCRHPQIEAMRMWYGTMEHADGLSSAERLDCEPTAERLRRTVFIGMSPVFEEEHVAGLADRILAWDRRPA